MKTILLSLVAVLSIASFTPSASAAAPDLPPLVSVCIDGTTSDGCYRNAWICVGFSYQIPACVDPIEVSAAPPSLPVAVCAKENACFGGNDVCFSAFSWVPQCAQIPYPCESPYFACTGPVVPVSSGGPEPMCMYYYYELDTGVVRYVARDSCTSEVYVFGERVK